MEDGFFELETAQDLYEKLCWEFKNLKAHPQDMRVAFNFFVTAEHIPDWLNSKGLKNQPIPKICSNLANGAKHFHAGEKHTAVKNAWKDRYVEKGCVEEGYFLDPLMVEVDQELAAKANLENPIEVQRLAEEVIVYWGKKFGDDSNG
jgi:hypothetical protein